MTLVVGATGRVGRPVVELLRQQGKAVRALCRSEANAGSLREAGVEVVLGDLGKPAALKEACRGVATVISTVTSLNPRAMRHPYRPEAIEKEGHQALVGAARDAGAGQVIYLSAVGVDHPEAPRQFRVKRQVEDIVRSGGLPHTILRPAGFMENLLPLLSVIRRVGIAPVPGRGTAPISYIAIEDVARVMVRAVGQREAHGATIEFGGPEDLSNRQCVQIVAKVLGKGVRICPIPLVGLSLIGTLSRPVSPGLREYFAILKFVDRYGLQAPRRPPFREWLWAPTPFEAFVRRHTGRVGIDR